MNLKSNRCFLPLSKISWKFINNFEQFCCQNSSDSVLAGSPLWQTDRQTNRQTDMTDWLTDWSKTQPSWPISYCWKVNIERGVGGLDQFQNLTTSSLVHDLSFLWWLFTSGLVCADDKIQHKISFARQCMVVLVILGPSYRELHSWTGQLISLPWFGNSIVTCKAYKISTGSSLSLALNWRRNGFNRRRQM